MSNIAIIPARGQSRRIPNKNRRDFHGKPILAYSIGAARSSHLFSRIVVSTEDAEIAEVARRYDAEVLDRPPELAEINALDCGTQEVTRHALEALGVEDGYACCLYPCSPMLTATDLRWAFQCVQDTGRQSFVYIPGWYYFGRVEWFLERRSFDLALSVWVHPIRYVDIDTPEDFTRAEAMYAALHGVAA